MNGCITTIGDLCSSISDTYKGKDSEVVLVNTSDVLEGKILNNQLVENKNLKGQFKKTFQKDDILYSEIRPANKRFAYVTQDDTHNYIASTKLMVLRPNKDIVRPRFLFHLLKSQALIDEMQHLAETRSGTFPQITFSSELAPYEVFLPDFDTQDKIDSFLDCIENKMENNNQINRNLSEQAFGLFDQMYSKHDSDDICSLFELAEINPTRSLAKNKEARCIDMAKLSTSGAFPDGWEYKQYTGGMRFINGDTLLARITPCLENGKTAFINFLDNNEVAFGSTEYVVMASKGKTPPELLYCLARYPQFVDYAVKNMNGSSGRQRVSGETIGKYQIPHFSEHELTEFGNNVRVFFETMRTNAFENMRLSEVRDSLLPKLMSGELDVSDLDI